MVNVTAYTIIPVRLSFYSRKSLFRLFYFRIDYIKVTELLDRLPTVHQSDLPNVVEFLFCLIDSLHLSFSFVPRSLSTYLDSLGAEYFNQLFICRLFVPLMFLCSSTRSKFIPKINHFKRSKSS